MFGFQEFAGSSLSRLSDLAVRWSSQLDGRFIDLSQSGWNATIMRATLSDPVPSPDVDSARHLSNNCLQLH